MLFTGDEITYMTEIIKERKNIDQYLKLSIRNSKKIFILISP
jgi:hypothetical protein